MNIPAKEANSTDLKPLAAKGQDYFKRRDLCWFPTMFSMHMKCSLMHNIMTTTFVTQCRSCAAAVTDKPAASSKQLFCEWGRECCWRELVLVLHSYILSKSTNLLSWGTQGYLKSVTLPVVLITIPFQSCAVMMLCQKLCGVQYKWLYAPRLVAALWQCDNVHPPPSTPGVCVTR